MEMTLAEIAALVGGVVEGDATVTIRAVASAASAGPGTLTFAEDDRTLAAALSSDAAAVLVSRSVAASPGRDLVRADRPRLAFARAARALCPEARPVPEIHPAATVDESAEVGDRTCIGPGCHVGPGVRIGVDCRLHANVVLYPGTTLGDRVVVHAGAVLGADGFGYVDTPEGKEKFPQIGTLLIEDDVEIGANTTIDRGALDSTIIRTGTKIDNLVQIAHNVEIGRFCAISSLTGIAGTTRLGDRVICGGQVGIGDHVTIGDHTVLAGGCGVPTGKILEGREVYWGTPARPLKEAKRRLVVLGRMDKLLERVAKIEARIAELGGERE